MRLGYYSIKIIMQRDRLSGPPSGESVERRTPGALMICLRDSSAVPEWLAAQRTLGLPHDQARRAARHRARGRRDDCRFELGRLPNPARVAIGPP